MAGASRAVARRPPVDDRRRADPARPGLARAGAAEPRVRRLPAPPRRGHRRLGRRLARDDRPRQPRGAVAGDRAPRRGDAQPRARARAAAPALPRVRRRSRALGRSGRRAASCGARPTRAGSRATTRGRRASPASVPFVVRRDALPLELAGDELGEDELTRLLEARGEEAARVFAAADRLRREVCGDEVTYVVTRNIQYTNVCYFRCGFCAFSKGKLAANLRGAPYLVPLEEIVRRTEEAWERGATEVCLQGGIHPAFTGDYYADVVRAISDAVPGDPRARVLGARDLAGRGDARPLARGVPRAGSATSGSARSRARPPRCSTTRCGASSARTR